MKFWISIIALSVVPLGALVLLAGLWLVEHSLLLPACILLATSWGAACLLILGRLRRTTDANKLSERQTVRDREAWTLIDEYEEKLRGMSTEQLADRSTQQRIVAELALKLARHYHPTATDAFEPLTLAQILATARVAIDDVDRSLDYYLPGGKALTLGQWRQLGRLPSKLAVFSKLKKIASAWSRRFRTSATDQKSAPKAAGQRSGLSPVALFERVLLRRIGYHLMGLYSGRDRGRSSEETRRGTTSRQQRVISKSISHTQTGDLELVTVAVVGEKNAGKTSLVQALLGPDRAINDRLPSSQQVRRYRVQIDEPLGRLVMLEAELTPENAIARLELATGASDLIVFVSDATKIQLETSRSVLASVRSLCDDKPMIIALTHVDQLAPASEKEWVVSETSEAELRNTVSDVVNDIRAWFDPGVAIVPTRINVEKVNTAEIAQVLVPAMADCLTQNQRAVLFEATRQTSIDKAEAS